MQQLEDRLLFDLFYAAASGLLATRHRQNVNTDGDPIHFHLHSVRKLVHLRSVEHKRVSVSGTGTNGSINFTHSAHHDGCSRFGIIKMKIEQMSDWLLAANPAHVPGQTHG